MLPVEVDSTGYVDAVAQLAGANRAVVDAVGTLTDTLYASGSMAGSDTGGTEWAQQYDPAAARLVQAGCTMGDALANMANLLNGSLANHAGAEHAAMMYPGEPDAASGDTSPDHGTESLDAPAPPSAAGGTGDQPSWWHWIAGHVGGLLWPDANTAQLRSAGSAWSRAGSTISAQQDAVGAADAALYAITSPEMDDVHSACTQMAVHLQDLGTMCTAVGKACTDYAGYVDAKHQEVDDQLRSFIEWTIGIEAGGFLLGLVTFGGGDAAAQLAEGGEIANAAAKVIKILQELIELARTVKTAIETAIESLGELVLKLGKFVNATMVEAWEKAGVALAKDLPEELEDLPVKDPEYGSPRPEHGDSPAIPGPPDGPSGYDHVSDPAAPYGRLPDGQPMTKAEYDARYTKPDGGVRWPNNDGALPGTRMKYADPQRYVDEYGDKVDRIGDDGGGYLGVMEDGKPASFEDRSLPSNAVADDYRSYTLHPENMPAGWSIETGQVAPAFGREGGGEQMFIANQAGRRVSVTTLKDMGILK